MSDNIFYIFCIDPGPINSGYAIIEVNDLDGWNVIESGTMGNEKLIETIKSDKRLKGLAVEEALMYSFPGGKAKVNNKQISQTIFQVGRMCQVAKDLGIEFRQKPRIDIITLITGTRPKRGHAVTKTEMQKAIQGLLKIEKPIRPQHANDAACAGLALYEHPDLPKYTGAKNEPKKARRKSKESPRRGSCKTK